MGAHLSAQGIQQEKLKKVQMQQVSQGVCVHMHMCIYMNTRTCIHIYVYAYT